MDILNPIAFFRLVKSILTWRKVREVRRHAPNAKELKIDAWIRLPEDEYQNLPPDLKKSRIMFITYLPEKEPDSESDGATDPQD